jgi:5-methylcytosine-specific restriction endonuclease McrA
MEIPIGKGHEGSRKIRFAHQVYVDQPHIQSYTAYVLLRNELLLQDEDYLLAEWRTRVAFSRMFLGEILKKDGDLCCKYCKKSGLIIEEEGMRVPEKIKATIDHVIPVSKGGAQFKPENLVVACGKCNVQKGDKTAEEFELILKKRQEKQNRRERRRNL